MFYNNVRGKNNMKVSGENKCYYVEAKKTTDGKINVTCGDTVSGMTSVIISNGNWDKLVKAMK